MSSMRTLLTILLRKTSNLVRGFAADLQWTNMKYKQFTIQSNRFSIQAYDADNNLAAVADNLEDIKKQLDNYDLPF